MTKSNRADSSVAAPNAQRNAEPKVVARVEKFPVASPKVTKESWESGEGTTG